jgi:hypothetical protein
LTNSTRFAFAGLARPSLSGVARSTFGGARIGLFAGITSRAVGSTGYATERVGIALLATLCGARIGKKPRQARETISFVCLVLVTSFFAELASWFVDPVCVLAFCTLLAQNRGTGRRRVAVEILAKVAEEAVLVSWIRELALFACQAMRNVSVQGDVVRVVGEEFPGGAFSARGIPGV